MFKMSLKICSYNCNSLRNSIDTVRELLLDNDIVFLQETLVFSTDLNLLMELMINLIFS